MNVTVIFVTGLALFWCLGFLVGLYVGTHVVTSEDGESEASE